MERGLLWLPLLVLFIWLAWAGWNEYQKVEAYQTWAKQFERAKYDIYAVLGQAGHHLTWGKPTRKGPINLETIDLKKVRSLQLLVNDHPVDLEAPPSQARKVALELSLLEPDTAVQIPFTDLSLATQWGQYLQRELQRLRLEPTE